MYHPSSSHDTCMSCLWHLQYLFLSSASVLSHVWYSVSGILSSILFMACTPFLPSETILDAYSSMKYSWEPQKTLEPPLFFIALVTLWSVICVPYEHGSWALVTFLNPIKDVSVSTKSKYILLLTEENDFQWKAYTCIQNMLSATCCFGLWADLVRVLNVSVCPCGPWEGFP